MFNRLIRSFWQQKQQALERTGKQNTNGPDMTVAPCTHQSFRMHLFDNYVMILSWPGSLAAMYQVENVIGS